MGRPTPILRLPVDFRTFGDPVLVKMLDAATEYATSIRAGGIGWLSFVGGSGTGKTYLGEALTRYLGGKVKHWPRFMGKMRSVGFNVYESVSDLANTKGVLLLDEIGVGNDAKTFGLDLLMQVMESRRSQPTILTSNLTMKGLAEIDGRLASRLLRHGQVIACDTMDYALRQPRTS
jgi:DNA replication protein DnaC